MAKDNSEFFAEKKIWSEVKDELLGCYLRPYIQKILNTHRPLFYVDCFAGKGKFDDGSDGSPLIALRIMDECVKASNVQNTNVQSCFIDLNYADDLDRNIQGFRNATVNVVSGKYEDNIKKLLASKVKQNIFLYIDPYGIMALDSTLFDTFASTGFNSIELLINFNSFGFFREACHAMKVKYKDEIGLEDLIEYDPSSMNASPESIAKINNIAGGDYWQKIVLDYNAGKIDGYEAEKQVSVAYCNRLSQKYRYVLNMPIRLKQGQRPKYRMIHATNHEAGCVLMYENICKRWQLWDEKQSSGQMCLFEQSVENDWVDESDISEKIGTHVFQYEHDASLTEIKAAFLTKHGVLCKPDTLVKILKIAETNGAIIVTRYPAVTDKGKQTTFWTEKPPKQCVWIRRKPC